MKRWLIGLSCSVVLITAFLFFPQGLKKKHSVHDEETYTHFCQEVVTNPQLYQVFRSHPLYKIFLEDLNEKSAKCCLTYLQTHYDKLLTKKISYRFARCDRQPDKSRRNWLFFTP